MLDRRRVILILVPAPHTTHDPSGRQWEHAVPTSSRWSRIVTESRNYHGEVTDSRSCHGIVTELSRNHGVVTELSRSCQGVTELSRNQEHWLVGWLAACGGADLRVNTAHEQKVVSEAWLLGRAQEKTQNDPQPELY